MTSYDARDDTLQKQQTLFSIKGTGWKRMSYIMLRAGKGFFFFQHKWPVSWDMMFQSISKCRVATNWPNKIKTNQNNNNNKNPNKNKSRSCIKQSLWPHFP